MSADPPGPRAAIFGLAGPRLGADERRFLAEADPWGLILFTRNVEAPDQVRALVAEARAALGREAPVMIDQEGGAVQRLGPPHWRAWVPPAEDAAGPAGRERLWLRTRMIADDLAELGIDVNAAPMLDLPAPGAHAIVTSRALGADPAAIAARGVIIAGALQAGGVLPVLKHMPGHGRAREDSHLALPRVRAGREALRADFAPFRILSDEPLGMTAHVIYEALDPERPATLSRAVIRLIRGEIGFGGLLMTDCLTMRALSGPMGPRAGKAIAAGCDIALHCTGDRAEMAEIAAAVPRLAGVAKARAQAAEAARRAPEPFDREAAEARYAALSAAAA